MFVLNKSLAYSLRYSAVKHHATYLCGPQTRK